MPSNKIYEKPRANPFVNKNTRYMFAETEKVEKLLQEQGKSSDSVSIMSYFVPIVKTI
jgi:hypothetical protein